MDSVLELDARRVVSREERRFIIALLDLHMKALLIYRDDKPIPEELSEDIRVGLEKALELGYQNIERSVRFFSEKRELYIVFPAALVRSLARFK